MSKVMLTYNDKEDVPSHRIRKLWILHPNCRSDNIHSKEHRIKSIRVAATVSNIVD